MNIEKLQCIINELEEFRGSLYPHDIDLFVAYSNSIDELVRLRDQLQK
jgi:hypothetical protein